MKQIKELTQEKIDELADLYTVRGKQFTDIQSLWRDVLIDNNYDLTSAGDFIDHLRVLGYFVTSGDRQKWIIANRKPPHRAEFMILDRDGEERESFFLWANDYENAIEIARKHLKEVDKIDFRRFNIYNRSRIDFYDNDEWQDYAKRMSGDINKMFINTPDALMEAKVDAGAAKAI